MTYDQWKTDSGYAERSPEQENEGRDCPVCGGDCAGANPPVYHCPMQEPPIQATLLSNAIARIRENIASFDADVAFQLANEGERADMWTEIDVNVEDLRILLRAVEEQHKAAESRLTGGASLANRIALLGQGACNCNTKSPDVHMHLPTCRYRQAMELADEVQEHTADRNGD
ncbi:hypothetical protein EJ076_34950 [Mesorhizobium sp. M7D.F.Ca.US.005.01.1.1]|uniref:hypothetical protein n=1 Tax=Mesorhizobium sp. M7D.F.Ca.US.005.01.1.1 TaxID=2493678 RepID=UPI000F75C039|nr:hypothetical protein [Mesorhizobium sp. M7D.F.Ca.US.005.01.1.1]AZO45915.1 hypothetical protein EJ076_34950 [Mesorhizobium sp. M7D.F.Ca.US.005.01.1.1]